MAPAPADDTRKNFEASGYCLKGNGLPWNHQSYGIPVEGMDGHKDGIRNNLEGNAMRSSESHGRPLNQFGSAFYPSYQKQEVPSESPSYPFHMYGQGHPWGYDYPSQDFDYFVVIDLEATCDKEKNPHPQEIIEFPSVIVSGATGRLEAYFQTYVRPAYSPVLSDFCKELTGIQQKQVNQGITLSGALLQHDKWLEEKGIKNTNFAVVTWTNWDCRVMLESECRYKKIPKPEYFNRWINLKVPFREAFGSKRWNLKEAVEAAGLVWEGRAHCGLDDAKNTARLLSVLMHKGIRFSITSSITWHETENLPARNHVQAPKSISPSSNQALWCKVPLPEYHPFCFCGLRCSPGSAMTPGLNQSTFFFGCGNLFSAQGASCQYLEWASKPEILGVSVHSNYLDRGNHYL